MTTKLQKELVELLQIGWTRFERDNKWKNYLEEEIKPHFPEVYKLLKDVEHRVEI